MPTYPFQKKSYWLDVKPNSTALVNKNCINPLLGSRLNIARSNSIIYETKVNLTCPEFLADHQVFNRAIMPAAGYLEMALSAGKDIFNNSNFVLESISIQQALVITESDTIIQFILTPEDDNYSLEIVSLSDDKNWLTHVIGKLKSVEFISTENNLLTEFKQKCQQEIDRDSYYQELSQQGLDYGESFQAIAKLWSGENTALAKIELPEKLLPIRDNYQLHPVILDACLQTIGTAFPDSEADTCLPIALEELSFNGQILDYTKDYWGCVELSCVNNNYFTDIYLLDSESKVIAKINKLLLKKATSQLFNSRDNNYDDWLYEIKWHKELLSLDSNFLVKPNIIKEKVAQDTRLTTDLSRYKQLVPELENLSLAYIFQAFNNIGLQLRLGDSFAINELINKYKIVSAQQRLFIRLLEILAAENILIKSDNTWNVVHPVGKVNLEIKLNKLQQHPEIQAELNLLNKCGSQLDRILQGKVNPLDILFPQGDLFSLTNLYQDSYHARYLNTIIKSAVLAAIKNKPNSHKLKILEIGAGTGSTTAYLLPELQAQNFEYTFSDISPLFLSKAKERFAEYDFVNYQILDIEQEQQLAEYDLIIAVNVIHATEKLAVTVSNVRKLLVNKGLFLLVEGTQPLYWVDLIFGLTDGWWKFKDNDLRESHPLITAKQWENLLQDNGFDNTVTLNGYEDSQGIVISNNVETYHDTSLQGLVFCECQKINQVLNTVLNKQEQYCNFVYASDEYQQLNDTEFAINFESSEDIEQLFRAIKERHYNLEKIVYLCNSDNLEIDYINELSKQVTNPILKLVQGLVKNNINIEQLVLVTQGAVGIDREKQITGLIQSTVWGMGKAIALEHPELNCTRIDLDPAYSVESQIENLIAEISSKTTETEIIFRENNRYLPRLSRYQPPKLLDSNDRPSYLAIDNSGSLDNLYLKSKTRQQPDTNKIEIQIKATGLNFRDVLTALNLYPGDASLGCECAGEIVAVGDNVRDLNIGDKVIAIAPDTFSQYATVGRSLVAKFPDYLSHIDAATIPVTILTAYYTLCHLGKIASGKRVLIHSAAGGDGQAAIQLAQETGAEVFATASTGKWNYLKSLGIKHIMNSRNLDFVAEINEITNCEVVVIILNSLSVEFIHASFSFLKADGCFLEIGKLDIWDESQVQQQLPNAKYHIIDMVELCQQQPDLIQSMLRELMANFNNHSVQLLSNSVFAIIKAKTAFRFLLLANLMG
ncbi:MAG: polyketide synthase dehydratase domain-containing protein [Pleurocapsa sp.]